MNIKAVKTTCITIMYVVVIMAVMFSITTPAYAAGFSPFTGRWKAIDMDGSDIRLTISKQPNGLFRIVWKESYLSFCDGKAGRIHGTGQLNESDPHLLEAELHLRCFRTGASLDFEFAWRYHPDTKKLSSRYDNGFVLIWYRPGHPQPPPPALELRVNYADDWVESFYESGHMAWITVTESDGVTVKATAEVVTEPKDFWGGETGFQTSLADWVPAQPNIQPNDWVFGWVDNGASGQVQIGEIRGRVHLASDSVEGTILAPWITDPVQVECLDWGSGDQPFPNKDGGSILTNGTDPYACSWAGEWDIQSYQNVGVGYFGPHGHWVSNALSALYPRIIASEAGDWFWTTDFYPGTLNLFIYESAAADAALLWEGTLEADESGFANAVYEVHGQDLLPGNYIVVSDGANEKGLVLETVTMEVFDLENEIMAGTAPLGRDVTAAAGPQSWQERITVQADMATGAWLADFKTIGFDITEDMRPWSFAQIYDEDGDANEASTPPASPPFFAVSLTSHWFMLDHFLPESLVTVSVYESQGSGVPVLELSRTTDAVGNLWIEGWEHSWDLEPGNYVVVTDGTNTKDLLLEYVTLEVFDPENNLVSGHALLGRQLGIGVGNADGEQWMDVSADMATGIWVADYGAIGFDITADMWAGAHVNDEDGDVTAAHNSGPPESPDPLLAAGSDGN